MKKITIIFAIMLLMITLSFSQDYVVTWNGGDVASDTLITTGKDTSDWINLSIPRDFGLTGFPETLSFLVWGDMGAAADSTKGTFSMQLTNDKTYLHDYGTLVALPIGTADPKVEDVIKTDFPLFKFARLIITAALETGDSSMYGAQVTKDYSNY